MKVAVFDVCDTLFYSNTTFDFVRFHCRNKPKKLLYFLLVTHKLSPLFWLFLFLNKLQGIDLHKKYILILLKGTAVTALEQESNLFYNNYLSKRTIVPTHHLLSQLKNNGYQVVLASSSIHTVVASIAHQLGVAFVATELELHNQVFTGKIKTDITGKKEIYLKAKNIATPDVVVSDNTTDLNLLREAQKAYLVVAKGQQHALTKHLANASIIAV